MAHRYLLKYYLSILVVMACNIAIAQNQQCFKDVNTAYKYLLEKNNRQNQQIGTKIVFSRININIADESELTKLHGIGSKKAQAIISYRNHMGKFNTIDDLKKVKGIGEKTIDKNLKLLAVK